MNPLDNAGNLDFFGQRPWRQGFQGMYCNKCITPEVVNSKIIKLLFIPSEGQQPLALYVKDHSNFNLECVGTVFSASFLLC